MKTKVRTVGQLKDSSKSEAFCHSCHKSRGFFPAGTIYVNYCEDCLNKGGEPKKYDASNFREVSIGRDYEGLSCAGIWEAFTLQDIENTFCQAKNHTECYHYNCSRNYVIFRGRSFMERYSVIRECEQPEEKKVRRVSGDDILESMLDSSIETIEFIGGEYSYCIILENGIRMKFKPDDLEKLFGEPVEVIDD